LCNGAVNFIIARDLIEKFIFTPLQSNYGKQVLDTYELPANSFDTFVYIRNGRCIIKSTAALYVLFDLGWPWRLLYIFIIIPEKLRDSMYNYVARNRYKRFGKRRYCMVPKPEHKKRFIEILS
jgi:predicted DCC family thiol-disulfide oxidoreductase YuxK